VVVSALHDDFCRALSILKSKSFYTCSCVCSQKGIVWNCPVDRLIIRFAHAFCFSFLLMSLHAYADLLFVPLWRVSEFSFRLMILALFNCLYIYISWSRVASLQLSLFGLLPPEAARMLCLQQCVFFKD